MDRRALLQLVGLGVLGALDACATPTSGSATPTAALTSVPRTTTTSLSTARVTVPPLAMSSSSRTTASSTTTTTEPSAAPSSESPPAETAVPPVPPVPPTTEAPPPVPETTEPPQQPPDQRPPGDPLLERILRPVPIVDAVPGGLVALTIDDGTSSAVVGAFVDLLKATGLRMTFFVNGVYDSWTDNAPGLRPLIDAGQVQLANHTWDHPYVTKISADELRGQITRNEQRMSDVYGVDLRPYFRPPYGACNDTTNQICADLGYPAITLWNSAFGDYAQLTAAQVMDNARQYLNSGSVILGHANYPMVSGVFDQIAQLISDRGLTTVTLNDVYLP